MSQYTVTPPQGENFAYIIDAEGIAFERSHILFMNHLDQPVIVLHNDEVRRIDID